MNEPHDYSIKVKDETNDRTFLIKVNNIVFDDFLDIIEAGSIEMCLKYPDGYNVISEKMTQLRNFFKEVNVAGVTLTFDDDGEV